MRLPAALVRWLRAKLTGWTDVVTLALLKSFIESGRVVDTSPDSLVKAIADLRQVWRETFGHGP